MNKTAKIIQIKLIHEVKKNLDDEHCALKIKKKKLKN